jgi:hypothetical protein
MPEVMKIRSVRSLRAERRGIHSWTNTVGHLDAGTELSVGHSSKLVVSKWRRKREHLIYDFEHWRLSELKESLAAE